MSPAKTTFVMSDVMAKRRPPLGFDGMKPVFGFVASSSVVTPVKLPVGLVVTERIL